MKKWLAAVLAAACVFSLVPAAFAASASDVVEAANAMLWCLDQYDPTGARVLDMDADGIAEMIGFFYVKNDWGDTELAPRIVKWEPGKLRYIEIKGIQIADEFHIVKNSKNNYYYVEVVAYTDGTSYYFTGPDYWEGVSKEIDADDNGKVYTRSIWYSNSRGANGPYTQKEYDALVAKYTVVEGWKDSDWYSVSWGDKQPWGGTATARAELKSIVEDYSRPSKPFADIPKNFWCVDAVDWAIAWGITNGTTAATFSPNATCTRAQILTFLYRAAGKPTVAAANPFTDVKEGDYFYNAAIWAYENGMVGGTEFAGATPCTRAETVMHLWKYADAPAASGASFTDVSADADYAQAVSWAVANGVTNGTSATAFSPDNTCTRAQIVTFLYRAFAD